MLTMVDPGKIGITEVDQTIIRQDVAIMVDNIRIIANNSLRLIMPKGRLR